MLSIQETLDLLNKSGRKVPDIVRQWQHVYYGISLHTTGAAPSFQDPNGGVIKPPNYYGEEYQNIFKYYLLNRHPRESDVTRNWRYSQYRPFTKDPFQRVIEVVKGAVFQDSNYSITLNNREDNEYIWGNNFNGYDLPHFFGWSLQHLFEDPNGFFVRIPKQAWNATTTSKIEPDVWFVNSKDVIESTNDELVFFRGGLAWLINTLAIFRFKKIKNEQGAEVWVNADEDGYYAHTFGYLPVDHAGGIWNTQGFYDSWLDKAKAVADEFASSKSAEQLVNKEASHPFIVMASEDCPQCNGAGREQIECDYCEGGVELINCTKCKGRGQISNNPGERLMVPKELMGQKMVDIISPDVSINKHHAETNKELFLSMMRALHLHYIEEAQSAVSKDRDMETRYQFISAICDDLFDRHIYNTIRDIIAYRNVVAVNGVTKPAACAFTLVKPSQFQIKTAADLLEEYTAGTEANVPAFIRVRMMEDYVDKQFGGDVLMKKKSQLIGQMDPICTYSVEERQSMLGTAVGQEALRFNINLPSMLDEIIREKTKDWFIKAGYDEIKAEADKKFAALPKIEMQAVKPANVLPAL